MGGNGILGEGSIGRVEIEGNKQGDVLFVIRLKSGRGGVEVSV